MRAVRGWREGAAALAESVQYHRCASYLDDNLWLKIHENDNSFNFVLAAALAGSVHPTVVGF
jgi:hypothetical protein